MIDMFHNGLAEILPFIAIGFAAQLVDGAIGMAFGAVATSLLIGVLDVSPAQASYRVHIIKCFTSAASGVSHALNGNIEKRLLVKLILPGVIGGAMGAYGLVWIDGDAIKPYVFAYLGLLGIILVLKGIRGNTKRRVPRTAEPLAFAGGLLDAVGGGGWGPVVSSGLMLQGAEPRKVIGSVNSAEFFVAIATSSAFISHFGLAHLAGPTLGLLIGGVAAAPFGALVTRLLPAPVIMVLVGSILTLTMLYWLFPSA
ncbi:sulfite exporter TauE/SafE family protein [Aurantiacibacter marinus]|uniref:Probable membrane transporter protein n=1 Tax=Aurantiacibacter marinus TaxID=874156 RepID=A0A0H0XSW8_9SPHN|nr:sulfite exporter TauE/SafE family protein [Aurantiacibacter marinus]KLI65042.1 membrane protein [Aurantiacibacter marinus]